MGWFSRVVVSVLLSCYVTSVVAAEVRFSYSVPYKSDFLSKKPKPEDLKAALDLASREVWKKFLLSVPQAELIRYDDASNKQKIEARFDEIVTLKGEPQVRIDEKNKIIQIGGRGVVNDELVDVIIDDKSTRDKRINSETVIGFLVLPRKQLSATSFDGSRETSNSSTGRDMSERVLKEEIKGDSQGVSERIIEGNKTATERVERSSGSTTRVAQESEYGLYPPGQVTGALSQAFTDAGFDAYEYADIAANCGGPSSDQVMEAMLERQSGDLSGKMRKGMFDATRDKDCLGGQFFILGTIDIDSIEVRQGFTNASAIINVQIFDLSRKIPKRIASIDSVRRDGEGSTEDKAVSNAISAATSLAGDQILAAFANRL